MARRRLDGARVCPVVDSPLMGCLVAATIVACGAILALLFG